MACAIVFYLFSYQGVSTPLGDDYLRHLNFAPSDWVSEDEIYLTDEVVIIGVKGASISRYAPTGSMRPIFDEGANGIRIVPRSPKEIEEGDIVSFRRGNNLIVHRVVEKGIDELGVYYITRGDNNLVKDGKIRFEDIEFVTIGVIW